MNELEKILGIIKKNKKDIKNAKQKSETIKYDVAAEYFSCLQYTDSELKLLREEFANKNIYLENPNHPSAKEFLMLLLSDLIDSEFDVGSFKSFYQAVRFSDEQNKYIREQLKKQSIEFDDGEEITFEKFYRIFLKAKTKSATDADKLSSVSFTKETRESDYDEFWEPFFNLTDEKYHCKLGINEEALNLICRNFPWFFKSLFKKILEKDNYSIRITVHTNSYSEDDANNSQKKEALKNLMPFIFEKKVNVVFTGNTIFNKSIILFPGQAVIFVDTLFLSEILKITKNENLSVLSETEIMLNNIYSKETPLLMRKSPVTSRWVSIETTDSFLSENNIRCISDGYSVYSMNNKDYKKAFPNSSQMLSTSPDLINKDHNAFTEFLCNGNNTYKEINSVKEGKPHFYFRTEPTVYNKEKAEKIIINAINVLKLYFRDNYDIIFLSAVEASRKQKVKERLFLHGWLFIANDKILIRYHNNDAQALCRDMTVVSVAQQWFDECSELMREQVMPL